MQTMQIRIPRVLLADVRELAEARGRKPAQILRRALAIGITELREDERFPAPQEQVTNADRKTDNSG